MIQTKNGIKNKATAIEASGSSKRKKIPKTKLAQAALKNEKLRKVLIKTKASKGRNATTGSMLNKLTKDSVMPLKL